MVAEEGRENRWERHQRNHLAFVAGIEAMGLRCIRNSSALVDAEHAAVPEGVDDAKVRQIPARGTEESRSPAASGRWRAKSSASA